MIAGRVATGRLHRVHYGVYAVGHPNLTQEGRFLAAVKACGRHALLSHFSAAALWGLMDLIEDRYPDVSTPSNKARPRINTHRSRSLVDAAAIHRAIPVTCPSRTLEDLARAKTTDEALKRALRQAQTLRLIDPATLTHRRLRAIAPAPTRSVLEDIVLDLIVQAGFAAPDVNVPMKIAGNTIVPDFRWPGRRLIVEADGAAFHVHTRDDDAARQALLEAHGERVLRVTHDQATRKRPETLARLRNAGAPVA
jgi:hypothetical protein